MNLDDLTQQIRVWAMKKGLDKAAPEKQMLKVTEEIGELAQGLAKGNEEQIMDSIGDGFVTLTILAQQKGWLIEDCVGLAYSEIAGREGEMVNGVFVKESDLQ
ncbi:MazG-like family protein [Oceanobacillus timonensis]|uniref:MazG-like family protein n=1 Tax=Oceanobacillus timonensis TaxID=1926285 RepID=UPI0009BB9B4D|nr:MazG-like family protein [Oceanobacillus timonensis]